MAHKRMVVDNTYINILSRLKKQSRSLSMSADWDRVMKRSKIFSQSGTMINRIEEIPCVDFCTGSNYSGEWDVLGMTGKGEYTFFNDVKYIGHMRDGEFHGVGTLLYPNGATMNGFFINGQIMSYQDYIYEDSKCLEPEYSEPDRRFLLEIEKGLETAGRSYLTRDKEARTIPNGCYDVGDGFYDPKTKCVYSPTNLKNVIRIPTKAEHDWIIQNCRKAWDEVAGYRPELYLDWFEEPHFFDQSTILTEDSETESTTPTLDDIPTDIKHSLIYPNQLDLK